MSRNGGKIGTVMAVLCTALVLSACGSTLPTNGDGGATDASASYYIRTDKLIVPDLGLDARRGRIGLYRTRTARQRYRTIDLRVMNKRLIGRPAQMIFHVDRRPVAFGQTGPQQRGVVFDLPATINEPDACYVIVQGNRPLSTRSGLGSIFQDLAPQNYLLGFKPYVQQQQREANLVKLRTRHQTAKDRRSRLTTRIQSAERRLRTSPNFQKGRCEWIAAKLPRRPHDYMSRRKANRIASGNYFKFLMQKYSCSAAVFVARAMSDKNEHMRRAVRAGDAICTLDAFSSAFGIPLFKNKYAHLIPRNEMSPLADIWEAYVATCALKGDRGCQVALAATLAIRADSAITEMERRLLLPTRRWQSAVARAKSAARQAHSQCKSDRNLIANRINLVREAELKVSNAARDVGLEEKFVADHHRALFRPADLQCRDNSGRRLSRTGTSKDS